MENVKSCQKCSNIIVFNACVNFQTFQKFYYGTAVVGHNLNAKFICTTCTSFDVYRHRISCYSCGCKNNNFYIAKRGENTWLFDGDFKITARIILNKVFCFNCAKKVPISVTLDTLDLYVARSSFGIFANTKSIFD